MKTKDIEPHGSIYAALKAPSVIGPHGELYALREDGAIVNVDIDEDGKEGCFLFSYQGQGNCSLIIKNDQINFLQNDNGFCKVTDLEDFFVCPNSLPIYPRACVITHDSGDVLLLCNAKNGLRLFQVHQNEVEEITATIPLNAFTGWNSGGFEYIAGMTSRVYTENREGFSLKRGEACIAKFDMDGCKYMLHTPEIKLIEWLKNDISNYISNESAKFFNPKLECWVDSFLVQNEQVLIGAIVDDTPSESDWGATESLDLHDYFFTGLFRFSGDALEPVTLLYPYAYVQSLSANSKVCLYFVDHSNNNGLKIHNLSVMVVNGKSFTNLKPKPLTFENIDVSQSLGYIRFEYDDSIGFYGVLSTLGKYSIQTPYFIMSEDGICWRVVDQLKGSVASEKRSNDIRLKTEIT